MVRTLNGVVNRRLIIYLGILLFFPVKSSESLSVSPCLQMQLPYLPSYSCLQVWNISLRCSSFFWLYPPKKKLRNFLLFGFKFIIVFLLFSLIPTQGSILRVEKVQVFHILPNSFIFFENFLLVSSTPKKFYILSLR